MRRGTLSLLVVASTALVLAGCGGGRGSKGASSTQRPAAECPQAWQAGWQGLADQVGAPVYCPTWMPPPLDAEIGGGYDNGASVDKRDRSYLVSFIYQERAAGGVSSEVHVNFRGYPGSTKIPACEDTLTVKGVTRHRQIPCFGDPRWTKRVGGDRVTAYTVNQGIDQWHVLYAWRRNGSLYTLSEHVAPPYSYRRVVQNLDRMMRGLALVQPASAS